MNGLRPPLTAPPVFAVGQSRGDSKECCRPSLSSEKGGFSLTEKEYKEHIQYTHNAYCRIVIRHASIDAARMLYAKWKREISLEAAMSAGSKRKRSCRQARKRRGQKRQQHRMKAKGLPRQKGKFTGFRTGSSGRKFAKATMLLPGRPAAAKQHPAVHRQPGPA